MMHAHMGITDGIYGNLVEDDMHNTILSISDGNEWPAENGLHAMIEETLRRLLTEKN